MSPAAGDPTTGGPVVGRPAGGASAVGGIDASDVDGVDVDAVVTAVRDTAGVDDLDAGPLARLATYLPGREVAGIRVEPDVLTVQIRADGSVALPELGAALQHRLRATAAGRRVDVLISDITVRGADEATGL